MLINFQKINSYRVIKFCLLALFSTGILYVIFWLIRPSEFLNLDIGIPHAIISIMLFIIILLVLLLAKFTHTKIPNIKRIIIFYLINILMYLFIAFFFHAASVSGVYLQNHTNSDLEKIVIVYPGNKIEISKLKKNEQKQIPIIPNTEGKLTIKGKLILGNEFTYSDFIPQCCATKFICTIESPNDVKMRKEPIKSYMLSLLSSSVASGQ